MSETVNVLIVGIGGQGVLRASQVLADVLVGCTFDVKQSEVHGMSQRGGSVVSEVRYGNAVHSPLAPHNEIDFLIALDRDEGLRAAPRLRPGKGARIDAADDLVARLPDPRGRNMAVLGRLSNRLDIPVEAWHNAVRHCMPPKSVKANITALDMGRTFDESAPPNG